MTTISIDRQQFEFADKDSERFIIRNIVTGDEYMEISKKPVPMIDTTADNALSIWMGELVIYVAPYTDNAVRTADHELINSWTAPFSGGTAGGATADKQDEQTEVLGEIRNKVADLNTVEGTQADVPAGSDTATASKVSLFKRLLQQITIISGYLLSSSSRLTFGAMTATANITTSAVSIIPANPNRRGLLFRNLSGGEVTIFTGTVAIGRGFPVPANGGMLYLTGNQCPLGEIFAIRATGSNPIYFSEAI